MSTAGIVILIILGVLAIVGIIFANGVSVLWAASILLGIVLVIITGRSIIFKDSEETIDEIIEKFDLIRRLRNFLVNRTRISIPEKIQSILILIMSAASVAVIVRAIVFVVNALTEFSKTNNSESMDWMAGLMADVPVLNVMVLMKQGFETEFRPDFFVTVLLLSLIVLAFAAAVVQLIMALVNEVTYEVQSKSTLFRILGVFSITTLTIAGTLFISRLLSPLLDFSKPWDWFEKLCKPFLSSSVGNFLLQVLVTAVMFALLIVLCFEWVQTIVLGAVGFLVSLILMIIHSIFFGNDGNIGGNFILLLCILYPITDFIMRIILKKDGFIWIPVAVPLAVTVVVTIVALIIGGKDHGLDLSDVISNNVAIIGGLFYIVYLLVMPGISIVTQDSEE